MTLRLNGSTSGYTEIDAPAVAEYLPTGAITSRKHQRVRPSHRRSVDLGVTRCAAYEPDCHLFASVG